jgi:c-di-GMP-binding flagellar brake protein YcgR
MPQWSVQRRFPRFPIVLPVLHRPKERAGTPGVGWTRNLGETGACLELAEWVGTGTGLTLCLRTDTGNIEITATVVWVGERGRKEAGTLHGVSFSHIAPDHHKALRELLRQKGHVRQAGVRLPVELTVLCRNVGLDTAPIHGRTGDISRAGLLLRLPVGLPTGTTLEVTIQTSHGPLTAKGTVIWVDPSGQHIPGEPIRHGFRFTDVGWASELTLAMLLAGQL